VVAASREQAGILFAQAGGFVRRSEWLQARVKPTMRELRSRDSGRIRVMAADADTADGTISTLAVVDEVARHRSAELYGTLRDGLGPRQGRLIGISTAGDDEDSPLGRMRRSAYKLPTVERRDSVARSAPWAARCSAQTLTARSRSSLFSRALSGRPRRGPRGAPRADREQGEESARVPCMPWGLGFA